MIFVEFLITLNNICSHLLRRFCRNELNNNEVVIHLI